MKAIRRDDGFTLPELLVSITLMAIVSAAIVASTVAVQRNLGTANATMRDLATARQAVDRVGSLLRGATSVDGTLSDATAALVEARSHSVTFYSSTGRQAELSDVADDIVYNPMKVQLFVKTQGDGQLDLVERLWFPTAATDLVDDGVPNYPATPDRARTIVRDLQVRDVFTYWTHYGDDRAAGDDAEGDPASRCGEVLAPSPFLDDADRRAVDSISFRLVIQEPTGYDSTQADLQGWARFASARDIGFSPSLEDTAGCVTVRGFAFGDVYEGATP